MTKFSNAALQRAIGKSGSTILKKALSWSESVNAKINELSFEDKKPFEGVNEGLAFAHEYADVAIVSSANLQAVLEEWERYGLLDHVDIVLAQDTGSKAFCIQELAKKGYEKVKILMTGDALGRYMRHRRKTTYFTSRSVCAMKKIPGKSLRRPRSADFWTAHTAALSRRRRSKNLKRT